MEKAKWCTAQKGKSLDARSHVSVFHIDGYPNPAPPTWHELGLRPGVVARLTMLSAFIDQNKSDIGDGM